MTFEGRQREWVSIAATWDSRFGDPLWRLGPRLGGRKTDGVVGGLDGDGDAGSERDPTKVDPRLMGFEMG